MAKCMLALHILLCYALLRDRRRDEDFQMPVILGACFMVFCYTICALFPDKDAPEAIGLRDGANKEE
eukprot:373680-Hanusia_phi.AAC.11